MHLFMGALPFIVIFFGVWWLFYNNYKYARSNSGPIWFVLVIIILVFFLIYELIQFLFVSGH